VADDIVLRRLSAAGLAVLSEESGVTAADGDAIVYVDPLDGSTNASRGVPWFATALCLADADGALVALVRDQAHGISYTAERGRGAWCDGVAVHTSPVTAVGDAVVGLSGMPPHSLGWRQFRALGAAALDLCAVACGVLDGYVDCSTDAHGVWDYAAGALVCSEAGEWWSTPTAAICCTAIRCRCAPRSRPRRATCSPSCSTRANLLTRLHRSGR